MTKLIFGSFWAAAGCVLIVAISSRRMVEITYYARATADTTVAELEDSLPDSVRDQKVRNQLDDARAELIDRRAGLSLATGQIEELHDEIARLKSAIARRETILADAWPAMESAAANRAQPVSFAGTSWQPADLSAEVDRLLSEQDRDEVQLKVRSEAIERLQASVSASQLVVSEMESRLQKAESEFDLLKVRREQAESESDLLNLLAAAGNDGSTSTAQLAKDLTDMEQLVREKEARNTARRDTVPPSEARPSRLTQSYERLERLKKLHERRGGETTTETANKTPETTAPAPAPAPAPAEGETNVTIVIQNSPKATEKTTEPAPTGGDVAPL